MDRKHNRGSPIRRWTRVGQRERAARDRRRVTGAERIGDRGTEIGRVVVSSIHVI
jgi:hypothetical protein